MNAENVEKEKAMTKKSIATVKPGGSEIAEMPVLTPMMMLQTALESGASMEQLERLMTMQERWEANEARKAFVVAMTAFKAEAPEIIKNKRVFYETSKGDTTYTHADLFGVCDVVIKALSEHDLSHGYKLDQSDNKVTVTCVLTHISGHKEETVLSSAPDASGGKNSIQAIGSAVTYLQRYSLLAACGLATKDQDNDGATIEHLITEQQMDDLWKLMEGVGAHEGEDYNALTKFLRVPSISNEMSLASYVKAVNVLKERLKEVTK